MKSDTSLKYKIGATLFFVHDNRVTSGRVVGRCFKEWDAPSLKTGVGVSRTYTLTKRNGGPTKEERDEGQVATTRAELLKAL